MNVDGPGVDGLGVDGVDYINSDNNIDGLAPGKSLTDVQLESVLMLMPPGCQNHRKLPITDLEFRTALIYTSTHLSLHADDWDMPQSLFDLIQRRHLTIIVYLSIHDTHNGGKSFTP
ncbi:hypothetical protein QTP88_015258 [Uroleucon formosanum]